MKANSFINAKRFLQEKQLNNIKSEFWTDIIAGLLAEYGERCAEAREPTLRDQFAMAALPAIIQQYGKVPPTAVWAYEVADTMLKARESKEVEEELPHLYKKGGDS